MPQRVKSKNFYKLRKKYKFLKGKIIYISKYNQEKNRLLDAILTCFDTN